MLANVVKFLFLTVGSFIAAFALDCFLVPNKIIDGGIMGISIMTSYKTGIELGLIVIIFNLPFIFLALKKFGKMFVFSTFYSIAVLALGLTVINNYIPVITRQPVLASVFGGICLGVGVGIVLKNNSCLDGTEILALRFSKKTSFSVGEIIMFLNILIYGAAGFVFDWDRAMFSMLTYFITYKVIDVVLEGLNESKSVRIISDKAYDIGKEVMKVLDRSVTYVEGRGGYTGDNKTMVYCIVTRMEITRLKEIAITTDPHAFIVVENVHEVMGTRFKKKKY